MLIALLATTGRFPKTERAAAGVPASEMFKACLKPAFFIWFFAMFLTSAAELAPGQWVDMALTRTVGMSGIWLLVYVSGFMFVMRHFAGTMVHKLSSVGLLWVSCLLAALGLVALSVANSPLMGIPGCDDLGHRRLLHVADDAGRRVRALPEERRAGHGAHRHGRLAVDLVPAAGDGQDLRLREDRGRGRSKPPSRPLTGDAPERRDRPASMASFRIVAFMPAVLLLVFGAIWLNDRRKGGFKPEKL